MVLHNLAELGRIMAIATQRFHQERNARLMLDDQLQHDLIESGPMGFDHGVGHPLLLLYDAKVPNCQKSKKFKGLGHYPSNTYFYFILNYNKL